MATHNRAGEIVYRWISGLTYEVTVITYTKDSAPADRCTVFLDWGDNTIDELPRVNGNIGPPCGNVAAGELLPGVPDVRVNKYRGTHTYPAPGVYTLSMEDPNRNAGVNNIPGSVNVPFYISSTLVINPILGPNNSPVLLNPPIDDGCTNKEFIHNVGAFDEDGDSLVYSLVNCRGANGVEFTTTYSPAFVQDPVSIDPVTGDFIWSVPKNPGQFNFAIAISEFRRGPTGAFSLIGRVVRDLQITIGVCNNEPPVITPVGPFCVIAGETLSFTISATDPDGLMVGLEATGGPFQVANPAQPLAGLSPALGTVTRQFTWNTTCNHIRQASYQVFFKATDTPPPGFNEIALTDYATVDIRVIGPRVENLFASSSHRQIELNWDANTCTQATSYKVYRRENGFPFTPDCEPGLPAFTGYVHIATVQGHTNTSFIDTSVEKTGVVYCYRIVTLFPDGSESLTSEEVCMDLPKTIPTMLNVDVLNTSQTEGSIFVRWLSPLEIDSNFFPPPYEYVLQRAEGINSNNFVDIAGFNNLKDTTYTDLNINTQDVIYRYRVQAFSGADRNNFGTAYPATQPYLVPIAANRSLRLTYEYDGPWQNDTLIAFRETVQGSGIFDSIGFTTEDSFLDSNLENGVNYCYFITTIGNFRAQNFPENLINRSQIACGIPSDTSIPCGPILSLNLDCDAKQLILNWTEDDDPDCPLNDVLYFNLYTKENPSADFPDQPTITGITISQFAEFTGNFVGCYAVSVVSTNPADPNSQPREGRLSNTVCSEGCLAFKLPNVFTPNNDGENDFFTAVKALDLQGLEMQIFNRWGNVVYETNQVESFVNRGWDGRDMNSGQPCAEGVYYYIARVRFFGLNGITEKQFKGSITLFR